jgi:hypothetical protein
MQDLYTLPLTKVTGLVIIAHQSTKTYTGTAEQLEAAYKKVLIHNVLAGWWGIFSFVWNLMALYRNWKALKSLHALVAQQ